MLLREVRNGRLREIERKMAMPLGLIKLSVIAGF